MLEDQNIVIADLKDKNKDKETEVKSLIDSKQKYRDFYEEKLQIEYDEVDKLRSKNEDLLNQLQQAEDDLELLKQELQKQEEISQTLKEQMKDKDEVIEFVE